MKVHVTDKGCSSCEVCGHLVNTLCSFPISKRLYQHPVKIELRVRELCKEEYNRIFQRLFSTHVCWWKIKFCGKWLWIVIILKLYTPNFTSSVNSMV